MTRFACALAMMSAARRGGWLVAISGSSSYAEAARHPAVKAKVQEAIDRLNQTLPSYETIKRFTILEADFTQETGELTPTMKVKRKAATQKYKREIDAMYEGDLLH